jgi:flagellar motor protein MotB
MLMAGVGCQNKLAEENKKLWAQNQELQDRLSATDTRLRQAPDASQLAQLQSDVAARDKQIADLQDQLRKPAPGQNDPGIEGIQTSFDPSSGNMTVNVPGDVLFDSGKATLRSSARVTLNKIASALKSQYAGKKTFVDGHTDSDPINKSKDKWEDNLDLSAARARAVTQYLVSQGVSPGLVSPRAFGSSDPQGSKSASRRVEIVVQTR